MSPTRFRSICAALALSGLLSTAAAPAFTKTSEWGEGSSHHGWNVVWNGYGSVTGDKSSVTLAPQAVASPDRTSSALAVSNSEYTDATVQTEMTTNRQLRKGSEPNPWEVAWLLTRYSDPDHFYALALKPNGWELSKQDPAYPGKQRFLATGNLPRFPVGTTARARIDQVGATLTVYVNGERITTFQDDERPYLSGRVGYYTEDAQVTFASTSITPIETNNKKNSGKANTGLTGNQVPAPPVQEVQQSVVSFSPLAPATGLVTNEWAFWNRFRPEAVVNPDWTMTSGSLFSRNGMLWSGRPDDGTPNAGSTNATNSAVFRLTSRRSDFEDVAVNLRLRPIRMVATRTTPSVAWDGVHIFLRYQDEESLYYASVMRRDGRVVLKKKCRGGPSNGGTYVTLADVGGYPLPLGTLRDVGATARTLADGSVELTLSQSGRVLAKAVDNGVLCAPITAPGMVGIRGDNTEFEFTGFTAR